MFRDPYLLLTLEGHIDIKHKDQVLKNIPRLVHGFPSDIIVCKELHVILS